MHLNLSGPRAMIALLPATLFFCAACNNNKAGVKTATGGTPAAAQASAQQALSKVALDQLSTASQTASLLLNQSATALSAGKNSCVHFSVLDPASWLMQGTYDCSRASLETDSTPRQASTSGTETLKNLPGGGSQAVANLHVITASGKGVERHYALTRSLHLLPVQAPAPKPAGSEAASVQALSSRVAFEYTAQMTAFDPALADKQENWTYSVTSAFLVHQEQNGRWIVDGIDDATAASLSLRKPARSPAAFAASEETVSLQDAWIDSAEEAIDEETFQSIAAFDARSERSPLERDAVITFGPLPGTHAASPTAPVAPAPVRPPVHPSLPPHGEPKPIPARSYKLDLLTVGTVAFVPAQNLSRCPVPKGVMKLSLVDSNRTTRTNLLADEKGFRQDGDKAQTAWFECE